MITVDSFIARLSADRVPPKGAIGIEVWGTGRDGEPNPDLGVLAANIDPQHGGGCWAIVGGERVELPTARYGWLGSAAATVAQHRPVYYRAISSLGSDVPFWSPRPWDADAIVAALLISGIEIPGQIDGVQLAILDAFDSSASASEIRYSISEMIAQSPLYGGHVPDKIIASALRCAVGDAPAETVSDTIWGAVQALIRAGDMTAAVTAAIELLSADSYTSGALSAATEAHPAVAAWRAERETCAAYVRDRLVTHAGVACVTGAPQGAWPYALAAHDWAVLSFAGRQGAAHSIAGSRRLPLAQRAAVIARANEQLTAAERAAGGSAYWAGAAGITGSRDAGSALSPTDVAGILSECATHTEPLV